MSIDASAGEVTSSGSQFRSDGKLYTLSPPTVRDLADFEKWERMRPLRRAADKLKAFGDALDSAERAKILADAESESDAVKVTFTDAANLQAAFVKISEDRDALMFFIWLMLRKAHPELGFDDAMMVLANSDIEELDQAAAQAREIPGGDEETGKP